MLVRGLVEGIPDVDGTVGVRACTKRFLKQVVAMFVTINAGGPEWSAVVRFVRDTGETSLPAGYRIFMFRCAGPSVHLYGFQHSININSYVVATISEITHPPVGFHLLHDHAGDHHPAMVEITSWTQYGVNAIYSVGLRLPVLPVFSPMFNDFRSPKEMRAQTAQNESRSVLRSMGWWVPG